MRYDVPPFDPFGDRGADHFYPANDAAKRLIQVSLTHRDIIVLFNLLNRVQNEYEEKLLTKFIVVEFLSLDDHLTALVGLALSGKTDYPLSAKDAAELKALNAHYTALRKPAEPTFRKIRNNLAAHRDLESLHGSARLWDDINPGAVYRILEPVVPLFDCLKGLNVYCWTKSEDTANGKVIAYVAPMDWGAIVSNPKSDELKE